MRILTGTAAAGVALACLALAVPGLPMSPAAAGTTTPACTNSDLRVTQRYDGAGAGHAYARIRITNVARHACHTGGYGGISYVGGGNGTQIGHSAIREPGTVRTYVLQPGQRLVSELDRVNAQNYDRSTCRPVRVDGLRVYVPNSFTSQYVPLKTLGCRDARVHLLFQRPYRRP